MYVGGIWVGQGCVMSPCVLNILMNGCMNDMKAKVWNVSARLEVNRIVCGWWW